MLVRIYELSKHSRFEEYQKGLEDMENEGEKKKLLAEWVDLMPTQLLERYACYEAKWDFSAREDDLLLARTMYIWLIQEKIDKKELELRIRVFNFVNKPTRDAYMPVKKQTQAKSYKEALQLKTPAVGTGHAGSAHTADKMLKLATQPAAPLMKPRQMTSEEREILNLILSHRMEVKNVPPFLGQVFNPDEVAIITELLQQQEYPLYAHLLAGQTVRDGISQNELLQMIDAGEAGLPEQHFQVQKLKSDLVRLQFDAEQRLLTFSSAVLELQNNGQEPTAHSTGVE
ncbi:hypothetical protein PF007_g26649 [Phytophthora fragariae]|nr:hypothetical protein PF007_g26649 [Phytophthora fragariae]